MGFRDAAGAQLDLHWHVLHSSLHPDADAGFWAAARPAELRDVACSVICREDALLQAVDAGPRVLRDPPAALGGRRRRAAARRASLRLGARDRAGAAAPPHPRAARGARRARRRDRRSPVPDTVRVALRPRTRARRPEEAGGDGPLDADRGRARQRRADELGAARGRTRRAAAATTRRVVAEGDVGGPACARAAAARAVADERRGAPPRRPTRRRRPPSPSGLAARSRFQYAEPGTGEPRRGLVGARPLRRVEPRPRGRGRCCRWTRRTTAR